MRHIITSIAHRKYLVLMTYLLLFVFVSAFSCEEKTAPEEQAEEIPAAQPQEGQPQDVTSEEAQQATDAEAPVIATVKDDNYEKLLLALLDQQNEDKDVTAAVVDPSTLDDDFDGAANGSDNCTAVRNPRQDDADGDGLGDVCDGDADNDGIPNDGDNCLLIANSEQTDEDGDKVGNACDHDRDNDGVVDVLDNCPEIKNRLQTNTDGDVEGDNCDNDIDGDDVANGEDNCPLVANVDQQDTNGDGMGDLCADDDDGDTIKDDADNCPKVANRDQTDLDIDNVGDICDEDKDGDGVADNLDNCEIVANRDQSNEDGDLLGDVCDSDLDNDGVANFTDACPRNASIGARGDPRLCDNKIDGIVRTIINGPVHNNEINIDRPADYPYIHFSYPIAVAVVNGVYYVGQYRSVKKVWIEADGAVRSQTFTQNAYDYVYAIVKVPDQDFFLFLTYTNNAPIAINLWKVPINSPDGGVKIDNLPADFADLSARANQFNMGIYAYQNEYKIFVSRHKKIDNVDTNKVFAIKLDNNLGFVASEGLNLNAPGPTTTWVKRDKLYVVNGTKILRATLDATGNLVGDPDEVSAGWTIYGLTDVAAFPNHIFFTVSHALFALSDNSARPVQLTAQKSRYASGWPYYYYGHYDCTNCGFPANVGMLNPFSLDSEGDSLIFIERTNRLLRKAEVVAGDDGSPRITNSETVAGHQPILGEALAGWDSDEFYSPLSVHMSPDHSRFAYVFNQYNRNVMKLSAMDDGVASTSFVSTVSGFYGYGMEIVDAGDKWRLYVANSVNGPDKLALIELNAVTGDPIYFLDQNNNTVSNRLIWSSQGNTYYFDRVVASPDGSFLFMKGQNTNLAPKGIIYKAALNADGTVNGEPAVFNGPWVWPMSIEAYQKDGSNYLLVYECGANCGSGGAGPQSERKLYRVAFDADGNAVGDAVVIAGGVASAANTAPPVTPEVGGYDAAGYVTPPTQIYLGIVADMRYVNGTLWLVDPEGYGRLLKFDGIDSADGGKIFRVVKANSYLLQNGEGDSVGGIYGSRHWGNNPTIDYWNYRGGSGIIMSNYYTSAIRLIR